MRKHIYDIQTKTDGTLWINGACQKVEEMNRKELFTELKGIQGLGIIIYLEGEKSTPETVTELLCIQEDYSYMRDYVYDKGVLKELHFDKVQNK